jgi:hypothetical protein
MGLIKIMSMGIGSAKSAVSVIEALERAIRRLEDWSEIQGPAKEPQESADSGYERFKSWEMLWKTGPISPATGNSSLNGDKPQPTLKRKQDATEIEFSSLSSASLLPNPSIPYQSELAVPNGLAADLLRGTATEPLSDNADSKKFVNLENGITQTPDGASLFHQLDMAHSASSGGLSQVPQFGFEGFISNFPQELDEFTAISCFDSDFLAQTATSSGASVDNIDGGAPNGDGWLA